MTCTGPNEEAIIFLLNGHDVPIKVLSKSLGLYTHRLLLPPALAREALFTVDSYKFRDSQLVKVLRIRV